MNRIVVLGTGSAVPSPERNLCSIALRHEGGVYLFDCGEGTQRQMMKYKISYGKVTMIMVTHLHPDHIMGIPGLIYTLQLTGRKDPLHIVGPKGTARRMEQLIGRETGFVTVEDIDEGWSKKIGDSTLRSFRVEHSIPALGYAYEEDEGVRFDKEKIEELGLKGRMFKTIQEKGEVEIKGKKIKLKEVTYIKEGKKIVISGDTMYSKNTVKNAADADILLHEANFMEDKREKADEDKHSTIRDAARVAKEAKVKQLVAYHISNRYNDMKAFEAEGKEVFKNLKVAKDGFEILI